ncbi:MAG: hypothetical protein ACYDAD_07945 [Acidimicrobiales bacterium]
MSSIVSNIHLALTSTSTPVVNHWLNPSDNAFITITTCHSSIVISGTPDELGDLVGQLQAALQAIAAERGKS